MAEGNGTNVSYTTKELLGRIEDKLDKLDEKLDAKADVVIVDALKARLDVLVETAVKRDGPIMREYWEYTHESRARIETMERQMLEREPLGTVVAQTVKDVDALKVWRNRFAGTLLLVGPLATISAGIILDRVLH